MNLKDQSLSQLRKLKQDVEKAIVRKEAEQIKAAKAAVEKVVKDFGVDLSDLIGSPKPAKKPAAKKSPAARAKPMYKNPMDPKQTWTGKGRRPKWFLDATANGKTDEELRA